MKNIKKEAELGRQLLKVNRILVKLRILKHNLCTQDPYFELNEDSVNEVITDALNLRKHVASGKSLTKQQMQEANDLWNMV